MDEVLCGSVFGSMLDTDDVSQVRVAAKCWNDDRRQGKMGVSSFTCCTATLREALVPRC